jgi:hypothetical protein
MFKLSQNFSSQHMSGHLKLSQRFLLQQPLVQWFLPITSALLLVLHSASKRLHAFEVHLLVVQQVFQTQVSLLATTLSMFQRYFLMEARPLTRSLPRLKRVEICWTQLNSNSLKLITL